MEQQLIATLHSKDNNLHATPLLRNARLRPNELKNASANRTTRKSSDLVLLGTTSCYRLCREEPLKQSCKMYRMCEPQWYVPLKSKQNCRSEIRTCDTTSSRTHPADKVGSKFVVLSLQDHPQPPCEQHHNPSTRDRCDLILATTTCATGTRRWRLLSGRHLPIHDDIDPLSRDSATQVCASRKTVDGCQRPAGLAW